MQAKIEWFQEVLSLDPGSKIFFPLAQLLVETGECENAVVTLRQGLLLHPEHLEARLLLLDLLSRLGREGEAREALSAITKPLSAFPEFWRLWAQKLLPDNKELAVFLMLVASHLTGKGICWTDVVLEGLNSLSKRLVVQPEAQDSAPSPAVPVLPAGVDSMLPDGSIPECEAESDVGSGLNPQDIRTRTMANLLAEQGDSLAALEIYRELWSKARSEEERTDLAKRIEFLEAAAVPAGPATPSEDSFSRSAKKRLIGALETLAARFDARVRAEASEAACN